MKFDGETKDLSKQQSDRFAILHKTHTQTMWKVAELNLALQKATEQATAAYESFQNFCVELEKEFNLQGKRWRVNEAGKLEVLDQSKS